jgi:hypothetical protein
MGEAAAVELPSEMLIGRVRSGNGAVRLAWLSLILDNTFDKKKWAFSMMPDTRREVMRCGAVRLRAGVCGHGQRSSGLTAAGGGLNQHGPLAGRQSAAWIDLPLESREDGIAGGLGLVGTGHGRDQRALAAI